jgi:hypothetical protein
MISFFTSVTNSNLESPKARVTTSPVMPSGGADSESEVIQASEASLDDGGCWGVSEMKLQAIELRWSRYWP